MLDLGMGTGKYGFLLREQIDYARGQKTLHLVGVDGWEEYVGGHQRLVYDEIAVADVLEYVQTYRGEPFDLTLMIDVIEHLDPEQAIAVARRSLEIGRYLLVATPARYFPQDGINELEQHRSWWPRSALKELGARLGVSVSVAKVGRKNVALYGSNLVTESALRATARFLRDHLVPDRLWYGARGQTGPTI